jgi:hypothetical protein
MPAARPHSMSSLGSLNPTSSHSLRPRPMTAEAPFRLAARPVRCFFWRLPVARLQRRDRVRLVGRPVQHILEQAGLHCGRRHAPAVVALPITAAWRSDAGKLGGTCYGTISIRKNRVTLVTGRVGMKKYSQRSAMRQSGLRAQPPRWRDAERHRKDLTCCWRGIWRRSNQPSISRRPARDCTKSADPVGDYFGRRGQR